MEPCKYGRDVHGRACAVSALTCTCVTGDHAHMRHTRISLLGCFMLAAVEFKWLPQLL